MTSLYTQLILIAAAVLIAIFLLLLMPAIIEHLLWKRSVRRRVKGYLR